MREGDQRKRGRAGYERKREGDERKKIEIARDARPALSRSFSARSDSKLTETLLARAWNSVALKVKPLLSLAKAGLAVRLAFSLLATYSDLITDALLVWQYFSLGQEEYAYVVRVRWPSSDRVVDLCTDQSFNEIADNYVHHPKPPRASIRLCLPQQAGFSRLDFRFHVGFERSEEEA